MSGSSAQPQQFTDTHPHQRNPHFPQRPELSKEEIRVLKECSTESFWFRCVPLSFAFVSATQFAVNKGYLTRHPKYGALFKNIGAGFLGYVLGKFSYQGECRKKILALPDSRLAEAVKKRSGLQVMEEMSVPELPFSQQSPSPQKPLNDVYRETDFSTEVSQTPQGLDDRQRPTLDSDPSFEKPKEESTSNFINYDDLREKNRAEFQQKHKGPPPPAGAGPPDPYTTRPWPVPSPRDFGQAGPHRPATPPPQERKPSTSKMPNKYGDVWDE